jgi:UDP-2,3-diacylglucosamine hydrolase
MTATADAVEASEQVLSLSAVMAPAHWRHVDFISDLHLQASEPATVAAWRAFMENTRADAVFILGDLFEVWVGDDVADDTWAESDSPSGFEVQCAQILEAASQRLAVFFMHGNRDFLLGASFAKRCGMRLLSDPCTLNFGGQRWLLSHGDALCLDDTDYMRFRAQVRTAEWQDNFLSQPLSQRQAIARNLRTQSEARKTSGAAYADADTQASCAWLNHAGANQLIHGHTHKPADHALPHGLSRMVLSDWDAAASPARAEVLRLSLNADANDPSVIIKRLPANQVT